MSKGDTRPNRFEEHEIALFEPDDEARQAIVAITDLPPDTRGYHQEVAAIAESVLPYNLGCASTLLAEIRLANRAAMARRTRQSGFGRRPKGDHVTTLTLDKKVPPRLWLTSQVVPGVIDPPWAPAVLEKMEVIGRSGAASSLGLAVASSTRVIRAWEDRRLWPFGFYEGGDEESRYPFWVPEQFDFKPPTATSLPGA